MASSMAAAESGMQTALIGHAQQEDVHRQVAGEQTLGDARGIDENVAAAVACRC